jgi:hypothetical protein
MAQLHQDRIIDLLMPDTLVPDPGSPPPNVIILQGSIGKTKVPGRFRVYFTKDLRNFVEIDERDVIHAEQPDPDRDPSGSSKLWLRVPAMPGVDAYLDGLKKGASLIGRPMGDDDNTFFVRTVPPTSFFIRLSLAPCCPTA